MFINLFPEIKDTIMNVMQSDIILKSSDVELQQRALEYTKLATVVSRNVLASVLEEMPQFQIKDTNKVLERLIKTKPNCIAVVEKKANSGRNTPASHISGGTGSPEKKPTVAIKTESEQNKSDQLIDFMDLGSAPPAQPVANNKPTEVPNGNLFDPVSQPSTGSTAGDLSAMLGQNTIANQPANNNIFDTPTPTVPASNPSPNPIQNDPFGLNTTTPAINGLTNGHAAPAAAPSDTQAWNFTEVEVDIKRFVSKHSSVLFENDSMQVGIKAEFQPPSANISLFFGNKTSLTFQDFDASLEDSANLFENFTFTDNSKIELIEQGKQFSKNINCTFVSKTLPTMENLPKLKLRYSAQGERTAVIFKIPLIVTKFIAPADMDAGTYFKVVFGLKKLNTVISVYKIHFWPL